MIQCLVALIYIAGTDNFERADLTCQADPGSNELLLEYSFHPLHLEHLDDPYEIDPPLHYKVFEQIVTGDDFLTLFSDIFPLQVTGPPPKF